VAAYVRPQVSNGRKWLMLFLFCLAEGMDAFILAALFPAINVLQQDLNVGPSQITWAFAAYSATFSAFLLISGRIADVYSARKSQRMFPFAVGIPD
jgi:MFS family permease